jgi:arylsulfatase A-like enzyme
MSASISRPLLASLALGLNGLWAQERPNILFIFSDDHAIDSIGAYDGLMKPLNPTPEIDRLAADGMLFTHSYCTNSICGPSRAVIQTGKHSHKNGFMSNGNAFNWDQQTFPKLLRQAGYQTALFGKSHLEGTPQGYDDWKVLPGQGLYYNPDFETPDGLVRIDGHCTDIVTDLAVDYLKEKRNPQKPFLLMVQHKAPHRNWMPAGRHLDLYEDITIPEPATLFDRHEGKASPSRHQEMEIDRHMHLNFDLFVDLTPDFVADPSSSGSDMSGFDNMKRMSPAQLKAWRDAFAPRDAAFHAAKLEGRELVRWKFQRYAKNYLRCIKGVDESVGRLMATLRELGLEQNTLVIYSSDQGFYVGDRGWYDKRWMYEESMRMPLIIKWPGVTRAGSRSSHLVQNLDYAETFLEAAGVPIPVDMQGLSLVPLLRGASPEDWRESLYYHFYEFPSVHMVARHRGIRTGSHKLIHFYQFDEWEMYDLKADPGERDNLYGKPGTEELAATLKTALEELREKYGDDSDISPMPEGWRKRMQGNSKR